MRSKKYQIFSVSLLALSILLFIAFILSSVLIYINQPTLQFQPDSFGFTNFLKIYSPSLQIGTSAVVFFTLWLTMERMTQTEDQINLNQENVKFNNYYKHKEEFSAFLNRMSFFKFIKENIKVEIETLFPAIYSYFFNSSYKTFKPTLNPDAKKEIDDFINEIKNSTLSNPNQNLEQVSLDEINKLSNLINRTIEPICNINTEIEIVTVRLHLVTVSGGPRKLVEERFKLLNNLFWTITLYEDILAFDGTYQAERANFTLNFISYRTSLGLQKTA
jgi:hypothetical protein